MEVANKYSGNWLTYSTCPDVYESEAAANAAIANVRHLYSWCEFRTVQVGSADPVAAPEHYTDGGIETKDFIEAKGLGWNLGNVVKYVSRAGKKPGADYLQDLEKAQSYLTREIEKTRGAKK